MIVMDAQTAEKINKLAQNLKKLHLATTMEEALERARQIVNSNVERPPETSLNELLAGPTKEQLQQAKKYLRREEKLLEELKEELSKLKQQVADQRQGSDEVKKEIEEINKKLVSAEHDAGLVEDNVEVAEEVQEKSSEESSEKQQ